MSGGTMRVGIVGAGDIVRRRHMPGFARINAAAGREVVRVVAASNRSRESAERFAAEYGFPRVYDDWRELVASSDVDAVLVGAWPYLHAPATLAALAAGKHVLTQARMAMNAREAKAMLDAAARSGRVAMICPSPTGLPADRIMRRFLDEDYLGDLYAIQVRATSGTWSDPATPFHWRLDPDISGVNTLNVGMYVEWVHRWFGPTRRISAETRTCISERRDPATGRMRKVVHADIVLIHGEMASGVPVSYEFSGVYRGEPEGFIGAYGSKGMLRYHVGPEEGIGHLVGARDGAAIATIPLPDEAVRPWTVEADWIEAVRTGTARPSSAEGNPSFADGLMYMDVTEAVYHGARTRCAIELPLSEELRASPAFPPDVSRE